MGIKRDKYDKTVSDYVRLVRDKLQCQRCKRKFQYENRQGLHLSHFMGRRSQSSRYGLPDPGNPSHSDLAGYNLISLCHGCHSFLSSHPLIHVEFAVEYWGQDAVDRIKQESMTPKKWGKGEKDEYVRPFKEALKKAGYK